MEPTNNKKPRICATLRQESRLLMVAALILILAGAAISLFGLIFRENEYAEYLFSFFPAIASIAAGALFIIYRKRHGLFLPAVLALACVMTLYFRYSAGSWAFFAALLILLSSIGWSFNISYNFLPIWLRLPVLNLASLTLALLCLLKIAGPIQAGLIRRLEVLPSVAWFIALIMLLPLGALILLNLSMEARVAEKSNQPRLLIKSVPREGSRGFTIAACILLVTGGAELINMLISHFSPRGLILNLPMLLAAILLLNSRANGKGYWIGVVLLAVDTGLAFFLASSLGTWQVWTFQVPVLLMLASAFGIPDNGASSSLPTKLQVPLLNLVAAMLFVLNALWIAWTYLHGVLTTLKVTEAAPKLPSWQLILLILLPLSLALLNLSLDGRKAEWKMRNPLANIPYRDGLGGFMQWLYSDVGGKLQTLARIQGIICLVLAGLSLITIATGLMGAIINYMADGRPGDFLLIMLAGGGGVIVSLLLIITTWPLYAFGQITSDVHEIKEDGGLVAGGVLPAENPDGLPDL